MNDIVKKKKRKFIFIILIVMASIVILGTIFGFVDYFRAKSGKKPIFIYHATNVSYFDVQVAGFEDTASLNKTSAVYYGVGYNVSICDNETGDYNFKLGYKKNEPCVTSLTCTEKEEDNFETTHTFEFFDGKLYRLTTSLLRPVDKSDDEDTLNKGIAELNDIHGVGAAIYKVNATTYEIVQTCNILNMAATDIEKGCLISYFDSKEIPNLTKEDILDNYSKAMSCQ